MGSIYTTKMNDIDVDALSAYLGIQKHKIIAHCGRFKKLHEISETYSKHTEILNLFICPTKYFSKFLCGIFFNQQT